MNYTTPEFKALSLQEDEFEHFLNVIVSILVAGYGKTITGRVVKLSDAFIELEHRDGRRSKIRRRDISIIAPVPKKEAI